MIVMRDALAAKLWIPAESFRMYQMASAGGWALAVAERAERRRRAQRRRGRGIGAEA